MTGRDPIVHPGPMPGRVVALYRYPVKGLSPEPLPAVSLEAGGTMPADRAFAVENGPSGFDPGAPRYVPKIRFLMLMRNARLATLRSRYDDATGVLTIADASGEALARGDLGTAAGRAAIEAFLAERFAGELRGPPRVLAAPGHSFSDVAAKVLHLVNLASVRDLERRLGRAVDPLRFRPNLVVDGLPPQAELDLVGRALVAGGVTLRVTKRTERCAATEVDPATGARDLAIPDALDRAFGHTDFGVYARVATPGRLAVGEPVAIEPAEAAPDLPF